jgi:[ribosomal protein S5]-alanine N-acetyltransferase
MIRLAILDVVETSNLILREIRANDVGDLSCFMTQARYQRHIVHRLKDEDEVKEFVRRQMAHQGDRRRQVFHLSAEERMSGEVIGDGFLICHADQSVEIGWGLHPALWSMGFGTEIGQALLAIGIEKLKAKRVWCKIMRPNTASLRLARKIGMAREKSHDDFPVGHGKFEAVDIYGITADAYFDLPY